MKVTILDIIKERLIEKRVCFYQGKYFSAIEGTDNSYLICYEGKAIARIDEESINYLCLRTNDKEKFIITR